MNDTTKKIFAIFDYIDTKQCLDVNFDFRIFSFSLLFFVQVLQKMFRSAFPEISNQIEKSVINSNL